MKIAFYCNDGSPMGIIPPYLYTRGLGGAEYALVSLADKLAERGHEVAVYNDPVAPGEYNGVLYDDRRYFDDTNLDVFILFRSPNLVLQRTRASVKLFWSCDQRTVGNYKRDVYPHVDGVICISPRHAGYFAAVYGMVERVVSIDLGVRIKDYDSTVVRDTPRVMRQAIFCSVPDRGLDRLWRIWDLLRHSVPDLSLVITSDYRLWGSPTPRNERHVAMWRSVPNVRFVGKVDRMELVRLQLESDVHLYPCVYDELFCLSVAETQVAGAVPFTSKMGALETTNQFGYALDGDPRDDQWLVDYAELVGHALTEDYDKMIVAERKKIMDLARERFSWDRIASEWERIFQAGVEQ